MATSQNGWGVFTDSRPLVPLSWVTGRVREGDVHFLFDLLCLRFNAEVEPIVKAHSWGWAYRAVRGQSSGFSNHASATAIDLNAPSHPLGKRGTFKPQQVAAIRSILADLDGVIRWGGDYSGRPDEMHFEINATPARVAEVARRLSAPAPTPARPTPEEDDVNLDKMNHREKRDLAQRVIRSMYDDVRDGANLNRRRGRYWLTRANNAIGRVPVPAKRAAK